MGVNLLLIGHSVVDTIVEKDKSVIKPGGLFYSALGMNCIKNENDIVGLITTFDKEHYKMFAPVFDNMDMKYSSELKEMAQVTLKVWEDKERCEIYKNITNKLKLPDDITYNNYDGILINMITGFDISLDDLQKIRSDFGGQIYIDIHTLSKGMGNNHRYFRKIPGAEEWLCNVDIVQANENELPMLCDEVTEEKIAEWVSEKGVSILLVTKGKKGATGYKQGKGKVEKIDIPHVNVKAVNRVGCGDIFGAFFFYNYIKNGDFYNSLNAANTAAGLSTTYERINEFSRLKDELFKRIN